MEGVRQLRADTPKFLTLAIFGVFVVGIVGISVGILKVGVDVVSGVENEVCNTWEDLILWLVAEWKVDISLIDPERLIKECPRRVRRKNANGESKSKMEEENINEQIGHGRVIRDKWFAKLRERSINI